MIASIAVMSRVGTARRGSAQAEDPATRPLLFRVCLLSPMATVDMFNPAGRLLTILLLNLRARG